MTSRRLLKPIVTSADGRRVAKVYRDSEWAEYVVRFYVDGKVQPDADYHDEDKGSAYAAAHRFCRTIDPA